MPKHSRDNAVVADRRKKVAAFTLNHYDQNTIASMLDVSQPTVSRDIKFLTAQWRASAESDIQNHVARVLAELELMAKEASANYINLKSDGSLKQANTWMMTRLQIIDRESKLLGLDKPQKILSANVDIDENSDVTKLKEQMKLYESIWDEPDANLQDKEV